MTSSARKLIEEAMRLPPRARLDVAAQLIASVEVPGRAVTGARWEAAWSKELDRRWAEAQRTGEWGDAVKLPRPTRIPRVPR